MIELLTTSVFVLSSIYGGNATTASVNMVATATVSTTTQVLEEKATSTIPTKKEIEAKVKAYFKDDPILVDIARCESQFRQVDAKGNILRGTINKGDLGVMQINEYYHADKAAELGFDLKTVDGNLAYAKYLYNKEGVQPWISSSKCWDQPGDEVAMK